MTTAWQKVFFDGGYRPEPHGMEWAVVAGGRPYSARDLGPGSSMDAEWLALLAAVGLARELDLRSPVFVGDALAVIGQAQGKVKCPKPYLHHLRALQAIEEKTGPAHVRYIKRTQNLAGIYLARSVSRAAS